MRQANELRDYERDWPGLPIEQLVLSTKDFIIFINHDLNTDWKTSDDYDRKGPENLQRHNQIMNLAAKTECIPSDYHTRSIRINFKSMIGEAIARSLKHDYENAERMLRDANEYITERNIEKSRYWYLSACGATAFMISLIGYIAWYFRQYLIASLGAAAFFLSLSCTAGALGALLSVIMRLGKATLNPAAGQSLHHLEGFYRIVAGCLSAFLIAFAVKLELLVPVFSQVEHTHIAMIFAGFIAGASERWAPSLISKLESDSRKVEKAG